MADDQTYLRQTGAIRRTGRAILALLFLGTGIALTLAVLVIGALSIAPVRQALLERALLSLDSEDLQIAIGDIGGTWPRRLIVEDLSVSDAKGEWLTLARLELDWQPLSLWRGEVQVDRLLSQDLSVLRAPEGGEESAGSGTGISLPLLPVDVSIGEFSFSGTRLGEALAGETVAFDVSGSAALGRNRNALALDAVRTDGRHGIVRIALDHSTGPERGTLSLVIEDGKAGEKGVAARLLDLDGLGALSLNAAGEMREGLVIGSVGVDGGNAIQAKLDLHGALARGTSLNLNLSASGYIVARELEFAGENAALQLKASIAQQPRGAYAMNIEALDAGALTLTGEVQAAPKRRGGWSATGGGRLAGLDRLLDVDGSLLRDIGWQAAIDANGDLDSFEIAEAKVTTEVGILRVSGNAATGEGFSFSGAGEAAISDLAPIGAMLGQPMQGEARFGFGDISYAGDKAAADLTIETSAIATGSAELDALLAEGLTGEARIAFGGGNMFDVTGLAAKAGSRLDLGGNLTLADSGAMQGELKASMSEIGAIAGEMAQGALSASAIIGGTIDQPGLSLDAGLSGGALAGFDARDVRLSVQLDKGRGPVSFRLAGADGTASLRSNLVMQDDGSIQIADIGLDLFGAELTGAIGISPDGLASGGLSGSRVALMPLGRIAGLAMDGRADIELTLDGNDGRQNAFLELESRRIDIDITEPVALERVNMRASLRDITGDGTVDASIEAESGATGNTRFSRMEMSARGPLDRIAIAARLEGERLSITAEPVLLDLAAEATSGEITLGTFDASVGSANARLANALEIEFGNGATRLRDLDMRFEGPAGAGSLTGDMTIYARSARLSMVLERLPLGLVSPFMPFEVLGGTASGSANLDSAAATGSAAFRFEGVTLAEGGLDIRPAFDATLDASWAQRRLQLAAEAQGISETPFRLKVSLPLLKDPAGAFVILPDKGPVDAQLTWEGPVATLMALADLPGQRLTGDAAFAFSADGDISAPQVSGYARISNGTFENFETGTAMRDLELNIEGRRSERLSFNMSARDSASGRLTAEGTISLADGAATPTDIRARFDNMRMVSRRDLVLSVEGDLALTGAALPPSLDEPLRLEGQITTTEARYLIPQQLPGGVSQIDVIIVQGPEEADTVEEPEAAEPLPLELDVTLAIGNPPARVAGRGVDSLWTGSIRVTGLAEDPVVEGVLTSERGTLDFAGKTFTLSRGRVVFAGERPVNPLLDIALDYARSDFSATVGLSGRGSSPAISLSSSPSLPRDEIISRILFGKGVGELTAFEAAQLANTAAELSGGGIGGFGVLGQIQDTLGLDVLRVDQGSSGGTTVSAGRYLREGFYVGVEQGALASDSSVKVEIDVTPNVSVETKIGNDASSDVGVNWKWDY